MTTTELPEMTDSDDETVSPTEGAGDFFRRRPSKDLAPELARWMRELGPGQLAELRRMNPDQPGYCATFLRALAFVNRDWAADGKSGLLRRWALIINGMALMTPPHRPDGMPDNPKVPVGRALWEAGYSEARLARLLVARGDAFRRLFTRMCRFLAASGQGCNWAEMIDLADRGSASDVDWPRLAIARQFHLATWRASQSDDAEKQKTDKQGEAS